MIWINSVLFDIYKVTITFVITITVTFPKFYWYKVTSLGKIMVYLYYNVESLSDYIYTVKKIKILIQILLKSNLIVQY